MAQTIKIKRSTGSAAPSTLASGELAYSAGSDTFYVGSPSAANTPIVIGPAIKNNAGTPVLATGITAAEIRSLISVDASGTDNSTNVTLAGTPDYLTISGQEITLNQIDLATDVTGTLPVANGGTGATTAAGARTALGVDAAGTDNSTNVTLVTTSHDYLSIAGQAITLGAISLVDDITGTLAISNGGTGATTAAGARTALGVDAAGTDNSTNVTLGASVTDILSISGQAISGVDAGAADAVIGWDDSLGKLTYLAAADVRTAISVDVAGTDNSTNVTLAGTPDYLTLSGQQITLGLIDLTTDVTGTLPVGNGGTGATTAAGARTALGVDAAGTDNSTNVTLVTTAADYLSITGQAITLGLIDLTTDVTGSLPIANGGTGSTTAAGARTALGLGSLATLNEVNAATIADNSVGAAELNVSGNGTAGQALVSDGDGTMSWSTISVTDNDVNVANLTARLPQITESVTIGDATDVTVTTSGDLVVTGDLTVSGTTTTVNTETILLADNIITVNSNYTGSAPTENGGIEVERGTLANTALRWNETNDNWEFTNDGSTYQTIYSFNPDDTAFNIGANATSTGTSSLAIGSGADATATGALSIGVDSTAGGNNSVAVGANASANNTNNVAVGYNSNAGGAGASSNVAIGGSATTNGSTRAVAIGDGADVASSSYSVAVGSFSSASSTYSTAIGYTAKADGIYSIGIGRDAQATGANTIVINASGATQTHSTAGEVFIGTDDGQITYDATNGWQFVEDAGGTPVTYDLSDFGTGTVTSIAIASPDGSISGTGTITTSGTFNLEVATIDGGTY